jgi:IstB-like ATP binding protein
MSRLDLYPSWPADQPITDWQKTNILRGFDKPYLDTPEERAKAIALCMTLPLRYRATADIDDVRVSAEISDELRDRVFEHEVDDTIQRAADRIRALPREAKDRLAELWPTGVPTLKPVLPTNLVSARGAQKHRTYFDYPDIGDDDLGLIFEAIRAVEVEFGLGEPPWPATFVSLPLFTLLVGGVGVGKTYLACALAREAAHGGSIRSLAFQTMREFLAEPAGDVDLLISDDLGTEPRTQANTDKLFATINGRYNSGRLSTIITTNLLLKPFAEHVGERTFDRIVEDVLALLLADGSRRGRPLPPPSGLSPRLKADADV